MSLWQEDDDRGNDEVAKSLPSGPAIAGSKSLSLLGCGEKSSRRAR